MMNVPQSGLFPRGLEVIFYLIDLNDEVFDVSLQPSDLVCVWQPRRDGAQQGPVQLETLGHAYQTGLLQWERIAASRYRFSSHHLTSATDPLLDAYHREVV